MQRFWASILTILCLLVPASVFAKDSASQVVVSEMGESKAMPTIGTLSFSKVLVVPLDQKSWSKLTEEEAKKQVMKKAQKLTGAVKKSLRFAKNFTKDFDANVSFGPQYSRSGKRNDIVGYQARAQYSITVLDLEKAQDVTKALLDSGVGQVSPLYPQVDKVAQMQCEKDALRDAVLKAKERAEVVAELMGGTVQRIRKAVINSEGSPRMYMAKGMAEASSNMYEPSESTCNVRVEVVFDVQ